MLNTINTLREENIGYQPSEEDVRFYKEHGWFLTPKVLPDELIADGIAGLEQHWSGHRDNRLPVNEGYVDWMPGEGEGTRNNEYISLQNRRVQKLAWHPLIGAIAAKLARSDMIRLFDDQIVCKPPSEAGSSVGWHVDGDYWGTCSSQELLTAWIPFQDCPEELGPLAVIDGSHKWSHKIDRTRLSFHSQDMNALKRLVEEAGHQFTCKLLSMERGQISFHHSRTIHGSFPNRGTRARVALALHMQDGANHYKPCFRVDGRPVHLFNDIICRKDARGLPDYSDDAVFPVLWRNTGFANVS
jgi:Phytanoyl-CoA dioxygenase (PhyH)